MDTTKKSRLEFGAIAAGTVAIAVALILAMPTINAALHPAPAAEPAAVSTVLVGEVPAAFEADPIHPVTIQAPAGEAAAPPVAEAPAEPEAPDYGIPVPWIADPNPNNSEGGYWDTTQCPNGSAYQAADGNQYCS